MTHSFSKKKVHFFLFFCLSIVFTSVSIVSIIDLSTFAVDTLQYSLLFTFVITVYSATKFIKITNIYIIFLGTCLLFLFNRIFLDILGLYDFSENFFPIYSKYSIKTQIEIIIIFNLLLIFIHFGFLASQKSDGKKKIELKYNKSFYYIGCVFFFYSLPLITYKSFIKYQIVSSFGYTSLYTLAQDFNYPVFLMGAESIFLLGFSLVVASLPKKKVILVYIAIYLTIGLIQSIAGTRALFLVKLIFIVWLYFNFYTKKRIKIFFISIITFIVIIFAQFMSSTRSNQEFKVGNSFISFFSQQAISMNVIGYMIKYKSSFKRDGYNYIFHPFVATFIKNQGQNEQYVKKYNSLSPKLTFFLNPDTYLQGAGIASSFVAELYDLGYVAMIISFIILGFFLGRVELLMYKSRVWLFLSPLVISHIIYTPRTNFFPRFREIIFYLIIFILIKLLIYFNKRRANE